MTLARLLLAAALATVAGCAHIVVLHDPLSPEQHNDLGVAYEARGEPWLAAREYRRALRRRPGFVTAWINLANVAWSMGDRAGAERHYRRALALEAANADASNNLAALLAERGIKLAEAEALARRALAADTARAPLFLETLGDVFCAAGRREEARRIYAQALARLPPGERAEWEARLRRRLDAP